MLALGRVYANEWMKLVAKKRFYVSILAAILLAVGISYMVHGSFTSYSYVEELTKDIHKYEQQPQDKFFADLKKEQLNIINSGNWKPSIEKELDNLKKDLSFTKNPDEIEKKKADITKLEYQLSQTERPPFEEEKTAYRALADILNGATEILVPIFIVILVADMISGEQTSGTIKLLLVRPVSRFQILFGKWLVSITATAIVVFAFFLALYLTNISIFGSSGGQEGVYVNVNYHVGEFTNSSGEQEETNVPSFENAKIIPMSQYFWTGCLLTMLAMSVVATITFLFSTLLKSNIVSMATSFGVVVIGAVIIKMFSGGTGAEKLGWLFLSHLNLMHDWEGSLAGGLSSGITNLLIWAIPALILSIVVFQKRDILNG